ncbi:hypothetical protein Tco_0364768 [Tanacetum coccineum]
MVGTRGTLANTGTSGNAAGVNHEGTSGLDAQSKEFIKQLIDSAMAELPKFHGTDVKSWLYRSQQFFSVEHVEDNDKGNVGSQRKCNHIIGSEMVMLARLSP